MPVADWRRSRASVRSRQAQSLPPGRTPRAHSSGGKERRVGISKQGDGYIRRLLVTGATAVIRLARQGNASKTWAAKLLERKSARLVSVALANKTARIAWAVLARNQSYVARARSRSAGCITLVKGECKGGET